MVHIQKIHTWLEKHVAARKAGESLCIKQVRDDRSHLDTLALRSRPIAASSQASSPAGKDTKLGLIKIG